MFVDELGVTRHAMSAKELSGLYKSLEKFIGDLSIEEYASIKTEITKVKAMIHTQEKQREHKRMP